MNKFWMASLLCSIAMMLGCRTTFTGNAKVPGGRTGCETICQRKGMELAGMVVIGEFSDGCVCRVRPHSQPSFAPGNVGAPASNASAPATDVNDDEFLLAAAQGMMNAVIGAHQSQIQVGTLISVLILVIIVSA